MQSLPADPTLSALHADDRPIPGFRLIRRRGRGGFGEVWEAEGSGGFRVALKFVRLSPRARSAELRALEFARGIHHPNLMASFGSWQVDDMLIIGMELADRSLWDRYVEAADEGLLGIPRPELLGYLADAAAAIDYLNEYRHAIDGRERVGIQHRDIKPPNILLCGTGAKVADLGMARAMEGDSAGHTGTWTCAYAAPEFFRGRTTRQSDQYGLAASYCQLRAGRLPYDGNAASMTAGHLFGQPDLDALPEAERPIVARGLAKEPGDRWPDCRSLVEALRALGPGLVPDRLAEPAGPGAVPRSRRPSGAGLDLFDDEDDAPAPSWCAFASTPGSDSFLNTPVLPAPPARTPPLTPPTAVRAAVPPAARRRAARPGLPTATALAIGAILTTGVHSPVLVPRAPILAPLPARAPEFEPAPVVARPTPEPAPPPAAEEEPPVGRKLAPIPLDEPCLLDMIATRPATPPVADPAPEPPPAAVAPAIDPPRAAEARGLDQLGRKAFERAIVEFGEAIRLDPARASAFFHRGVALHHAGRLREALADYAEAVRLRPLDPAAWDARGRAHHDLGQYDRAIADLSETIRLLPIDPSARYRRGMARYHAGDNPGAIADFTETIRLEPDNARAYKYRGEAHARTGAGARAGADHDRSLALERRGARPTTPGPRPTRR